MDNFINQNGIKILNSLSDGIYVIDKEFKVRFVNNAAYAILNKRSEELVGHVCTNLCKSERCEIGCPVTEVLQTGKSITDLESTLSDNLGNLIPVKLNVSILKDEQNVAIGGIISFKKNVKNRVEGYILKENRYYGIIGKSKKMLALFDVINEISDSYATVLITGETGVGKELIANAVKETSSRNKAPFVKVNCAALPNTLLASELFGHVKGAFTDARNDRIGRFELADGGTIFLDEIAEIPLEMQAQLLRVLQDGTFERLGDSKTRKTDIRIIAATNRNLKEEISKKRFREDLYYRLNVVPLHVPPLRERKDDIIHLTKFFINKFNEKYGKEIESVDNDTIEILLNYDWPGNIRELENCIEYSIIRAKRKDYICSCSLPPLIRQGKRCSEKLSIKDIEIDEKTETIIALLRQNNWNKSKVAEILGINRSTIHRKLKNLSKQNMQ